jgi:aminoglycoside phosphotransferase (APT) family kinase protein
MEALAPPLARGNVADIHPWKEGRVLKLFHSGYTEEHARREAELTRAARDAGIAVPEVIDVVSAQGRAGLVLEWLQGRTMLHALVADPASAVGMARQFGALHALIHSRAGPAFPSQREVLLAQIAQAADLPERLRSTALQLLEQLPDGDSICHGDFHPLNVLLAPGRPVVLDWFKATRGNPDADLARTALVLSFVPVPGDVAAHGKGIDGPTREAFYSAYRAQYNESRPYSDPNVRRWVVPVAVARLATAISANERAALLAVVQRLTAPTPGEA